MLFTYFAAASDPDAADSLRLATVDVSGVEPLVQLGALEEILTGRDYDAIVEGPRAAALVHETRREVVVTLTDELRDALAGLVDVDLPPVAARWAETEEFGGVAEPEELAEVLVELRELASSARAQSANLYCAFPR